MSSQDPPPHTVSEVNFGPSPLQHIAHQGNEGDAGCRDDTAEHGGDVGIKALALRVSHGVHISGWPLAAVQLHWSGDVSVVAPPPIGLTPASAADT